MKGKYMAYVGSYSYTGKAKGITVFDVDVEAGTFKERCEVEVENSSYVIASSDGKTLYSIGTRAWCPSAFWRTAASPG